MPESESTPRQQKAKMFFQYGNDAALKNNFPYAVQMYQEACKLVPENLVYRQALRGIERRKFGNDPAKVGRLVGARIQPSRMRISTAKAKGQWAHVLELCEDIFVHDPWNIHTATDQSEAAENLGLKELARFAMESVFAQGQGEANFLRRIAHVYELNEDWQKAIDCWERVRKIDPYDEHAKRQINALSASATIQRSGLQEAVGRDKEEPAAQAIPESFAPELDELKSLAKSPEERLLQEIGVHPDRVGLYLELADLHKAHNRLDEAEKILGRGLKANPREEVLKTAYSEVQISRMHRAIEHLTKKVRAFPDDDEAKAKLAQIQERLNAYEVAEYRRRLNHHPDDLNLRFQYGVRLTRVGKHDEAIAEFQQARNSPNLKVQALHQLGLSFEAKNLPKLAERNYQEALKALDDDDRTMQNALNYRLGRVFEAMGNAAKAEEHYNEVAANDFGYLDVAQRLSALAERSAE